jgi:hypothetical protein
MDDTTSQQLMSRKDGGFGKIVYMGHRRWLENDDPWRNRGDLFNVRLSIEDLPIRGAAPKLMSC